MIKIKKRSRTMTTITQLPACVCVLLSLDPHNVAGCSL